jgi:multidrug efflux pump subunit AcrA (membrane-fusion protein)
MKSLWMSISLAASLVLLIAEFPSQPPLKLGFVGNAEAIIGLPWTPLSFAGVARRSMYRQAVAASAMNAAAAQAAAANMAAANAAAAQAAAANAAAAQAAAANAAAAAAAAQRAAATLPIGSTVPYLPPNCSSTVINGTNYFNCGGVYYKPGFEGNHIVYIVSVP